MKKTTLFSLSLLTIASQSYASDTQSHRLAFSKAENVEVFVDHAADTQWCSPSLTMRFAFGNPLAEVAAVKSLLPKLGVLLDSQCPAAESIKWQAVNNAAEQAATGVADKAGAWQAQVDSSATATTAKAINDGTADKAAANKAAADQDAADKAAADKAAADKAAADKAAADKAAADKAAAEKAAADKITENSTAADKKTLVTEPAADKAAAEQAAADKAAADKAAADKAGADKAAADKAAAEQAAADKAGADKAAADKAAADKAAADKAAADKASADKAAADKAAADKAAADKAAADKAGADKAGADKTAAEDASAVFSVNDWQPKTAADVFAADQAFQELADSNSCKFRFSKRFDLGQQPYEFTSNAKCDAQGYAQGKATVKFVRSDGKVLHNSEHFFVEGVPFSAEHHLPLVDSNEEGELIFLLEADQKNKYYYLLKASLNYNGNWYLDQDKVYLLTEKKDDFRQAEPIRLAMLAPIAGMVKLSERNTGFNVLAFDNLNEAVFKRNQQHYLYQGSVNKPWRSDWQFDPNRATNYLFQNEARVAQQEKQNAERKAQEEKREKQRVAYEKKLEIDREGREASSELAIYESLVESEQDFDKLLQSRLTDLDFNKNDTGEYQALISGRAASYQQVVQITKEKDGEFWTDYPYQAVISQGEAETQLQKGWYFISGTQTLDTERKDSNKFYLTKIEAKNAYLCADKGCEDFFTPLNLVRLRVNDPNWTVEQAEQKVLAAEEVRNEY